ncbi:helix-turn-helix transcriptional regulator [Rhodococcoides fascians]|uniref:helix-turn-helix transcriptional regulator n=1 Tax=Rhodococcoides fascians TaxID=1828 RepID=UPI002151A8E6|nr:transcriptional regulator [Rhodococcus fascians]
MRIREAVMDADELSLAEVLTLIERRTGKAITSSTWRSYVARGQAPKPIRRISNAPLYSQKAIEQWIADRPGSGARTDLRP